MSLSQLLFMACAGSLTSALLVIDTQRFNGSAVDGGGGTDALDGALVVPGRKSGGGHAEGGLPQLVRALPSPFASVRIALRKCKLFSGVKKMDITIVKTVYNKAETMVRQRSSYITDVPSRKCDPQDGGTSWFFANVRTGEAIFRDAVEHSKWCTGLLADCSAKSFCKEFKKLSTTKVAQETRQVSTTGHGTPYDAVFYATACCAKIHPTR
mmetsp:Transcript_213/g.740  ORF Transcript_213/g.740 Transcript_213/m.740 type:complete len:211 (+) Transcript_213:83-715(+)